MADARHRTRVRSKRQQQQHRVQLAPNYYQDSDAVTDEGVDDIGSQSQSLRNMNMGSFGAQPNSRQNSRLQNTQKTGLGNGNAGAGWSFGAPASGSSFGAPGLARPGQLSGFAQIMGGGGQTQIDMK